MNEHNKSHKWKYTLGIILVLVPALTNPTEEQHKQVVFDRLSQHAAKEGVWSMLALAVGKDLVLAQFRYHNYVLASTTTYNDKRLTIGVLGNVFVVGD